MQIRSRSILALFRCPSVGRIAYAPPRLWPAPLARRDSPFMASASSNLVCHPLNSLFGSLRKQSKLHSYSPFAYATTECINAANMRNYVTHEISDDNPLSPNYIWFPHVLESSSHRDGLIYENLWLKQEWPEIDFADNNETRLEPMMLSRPTKWCLPDVERCIHFPFPMLQFFSLTLAECPVNIGSLQLYGYIAARDGKDCMFNYIFNRSRDDPILVQQGSSPIEMTGPKRGIEVDSPVIIEFDMRIRNGEQEEDDLELIDGAIVFKDQRPWRPTKHRINGSWGAVDMSLTCMEYAVEATIEVVISKVHSGFSLSLSSFVLVMEDCEEIQLFRGTIDKACGLRRFVIAVTCGTVMLLRFNIGDAVERMHYFKAKVHGSARRRIKLKSFADISVKVTWSTV